MNLLQAIEDERARLMTVDAVLHCVVNAMDAGDCSAEHAPDFSSVISLARGLVIESIDRLDRARIQPMIR